MNMLQHLFGRRVGVRCAQPAENAPGPKGRNASIHGLTPLVQGLTPFLVAMALSTFVVQGQSTIYLHDYGTTLILSDPGKSSPYG